MRVRRGRCATRAALRVDGGAASVAAAARRGRHTSLRFAMPANTISEAARSTTTTAIASPTSRPRGAEAEADDASAFTDWELDRYSIVAGLLALAGGGLAVFELQIRKRFLGPAVATWALLYAAFVVYVLAAS